MKIITILPHEIQLEVQEVQFIGRPPEQCVMGGIAHCEGVLEDHQTRLRLTTRLTVEELAELLKLTKQIASRLESTDLTDHQDARVW